MPSFTYPDLPVDGLLRAAAVRDPDGIALRTPDGPVSFGGLDARADRVAAFLRGALGEPRGARVGVANTLDAAFAAAYYGALRAGAVVVLVDPLMTEEGLRHVCAAGEVELVFAPARVAEPLNTARAALAGPLALVVTDAADGVLPGDALPWAAALAAADPQPAGLGRLDPDRVACVQFTTGTSGRPRGVRLTHRNLVANARQTALAHGLGPDSVTLAHLPLLPAMHLNSAVYAGACQVLCADPDPVASLAAAAQAGATHYLGLPARLHRLAADPRLAALPRPAGGERLTSVLSGGSALLPAAARTLRERLGVPVLQGYGMAELSPLTHCQRPGGHREGAVGLPVPGTECRLVDVATRVPVEVWATGEVEVRGPQLMAGYLGGDRPPTGPDGWFATGDVGYLDDAGELHLVARVADVLGRDDDSVPPGRAERVPREDPRAAEPERRSPAAPAGAPVPYRGSS
ncbi:AMP-dependent synthetase [Streptomyces solincola]|uniref:AMP-dependent synthetase n=1 Tax=Streptomyces solincola TaxID=2100817 RepID=A0A2S9Q376_9ACTN|nr:AMP-binding protein [Streptomyces solincola]PRH81134.1 AMP-dependent synthetase [Streptomyces solincola]